MEDQKQRRRSIRNLRRSSTKFPVPQNLFLEDKENVPDHTKDVFGSLWVEGYESTADSWAKQAPLPHYNNKTNDQENLTSAKSGEQNCSGFLVDIPDESVQWPGLAKDVESDSSMKSPLSPMFSPDLQENFQDVQVTQLIWKPTALSEDSFSDCYDTEDTQTSDITANTCIPTNKTYTIATDANNYSANDDSNLLDFFHPLSQNSHDSFLNNNTNYYTCQENEAFYTCPTEDNVQNHLVNHTINNAITLTEEENAVDVSFASTNKNDQSVSLDKLQPQDACQSQQSSFVDQGMANHCLNYNKDSDLFSSDNAVCNVSLIETSFFKDVDSNRKSVVNIQKMQSPPKIILKHDKANNLLECGGKEINNKRSDDCTQCTPPNFQECPEECWKQPKKNKRRSSRIFTLEEMTFFSDSLNSNISAGGDSVSPSSYQFASLDVTSNMSPQSSVESADIPVSVDIDYNNFEKKKPESSASQVEQTNDVLSDLRVQTVSGTSSTEDMTFVKDKSDVVVDEVIETLQSLNVESESKKSKGKSKQKGRRKSSNMFKPSCVVLEATVDENRCLQNVILGENLGTQDEQDKNKLDTDKAQACDVQDLNYTFMCDTEWQSYLSSSLGLLSVQDNPNNENNHNPEDDMADSQVAAINNIRRSTRIKPSRKSWDLYQANNSFQEVKKRGRGRPRKVCNENGPQTSSEKEKCYTSNVNIIETDNLSEITEQQNNSTENLLESTDNLNEITEQQNALAEALTYVEEPIEEETIIDPELEKLYRNKTFEWPDKGKKWKTIPEAPFSLRNTFSAKTSECQIIFEDRPSIDKLKQRHSKALKYRRSNPSKTKKRAISSAQFWKKMYAVEQLLESCSPFS